MAPEKVCIGCAGWALHKKSANVFPVTGSHLERYAHSFKAVEINSSFYRPHRRTTYERWAASVPKGFMFSVKMPNDITHKARLAASEDRMDSFLGEVRGLGAKLGPLLIQLPPSLAFDTRLAGGFFAALRERFSGAVVCEPRHPSWLGRAPVAMLRKFRIGRVAADPATVPAAAKPGAFGGLCYYRLHGSPRMYYSAYDEQKLATLAASIRKDVTRGHDVWCIFDNTAEGAAQANALSLQTLLGALSPA
jgi:uncharacterized protein YecE (DUF72 family)